ncbi:hypothetical protein LLS47_23730 [Rouxiella badensis]|uniref:hypothetical protein n=1 Tax=Rouxiella badensis TaxID=1646377 RepID=UPI001D13BF2F|nr:hypothetical protein [Rouxiella badensis]MCC3735914.1 hypothetical protein [Rouxiella badensis]MCC3761311.1 hypothetical protein [Rouxiella badensis]
MLDFIIMFHTVATIFTHNTLASVVLFIASLYSMVKLSKMEKDHALSNSELSASSVYMFTLVIGSVSIMTLGFSVYAICASLVA